MEILLMRLVKAHLVKFILWIEFPIPPMACDLAESYRQRRVTPVAQF